MSDKYVIEFDDEKIFVKGCSYRRISGTNILVYADTIKNLTPAESKEEKKTIKDITNGDRYFYLDSCGDIDTAIWGDDHTDKFREGCGNVFLTRKEAEFELKRKEIMGVIRKYAEPLDTPWDCEKEHFYIMAQLDEREKITINYRKSCKREGFHFATIGDAQKVVNEVGEADLLKYYFMV